jgi:hypothetical protein
MKTIEASLAMSGQTASPSNTRVAGAGELTNPPAEVEARRSAWQQLIDYQLVDWGGHPSSLADDDLPAPSAAVIHRACLVAQAFRDAGAPPPQRVCTDGEGGVVFERGTGAAFQALHVQADCSVELVTMAGSRVRSRTPIL